MSGEMNLDALQDAVVNFAHEREWEQFHLILFVRERISVSMKRYWRNWI
jgi:hypothetical protein